jgi:hypothetical protein
MARLRLHLPHPTAGVVELAGDQLLTRLTSLPFPLLLLRVPRINMVAMAIIIHNLEIMGLLREGLNRRLVREGP